MTPMNPTDKYQIECECGAEFETEEEYLDHFKSDFKKHPILFDKGFSEGIKP